MHGLCCITVLNLLSFGIIAISYLKLYQTTVSSNREAGMKNVEPKLAKRVSLIIATDAACWLPIIILGIVSLCGVPIPSEVNKY